MHSKLLLILLIVFYLLRCHANDEPGRTNRYTVIYYSLFVYFPEQERKRQCSQPNAIEFSYVANDGSKVYCLNQKVSQGLIYDANTNLAITADTLSPGQSFLCKCPPEFNGGAWYRGNKVEDNPPNGVAITFIQFNNSKNNMPLQYLTNYNQIDNIYCISQCSATDNTAKYQFLKIR